MWSRTEDDLLVQVVKHSTSDVLGRDGNEVVSELSGHSKYQYKDHYRLTDTVVELTFVFLCVIFRVSPFLRSSYVLTKDEEIRRKHSFKTNLDFTYIIRIFQFSWYSPVFWQKM